MFADYDFYADEYGGTAISTEDFKRYGNRATAYLNSLMTLASEPIARDVKLAMCAVADEMHRGDANGGAEIQSENVDGYSVTYKLDTRSQARRWYEAAAMYLSATGLIGRWI